MSTSPAGKGNAGLMRDRSAAQGGGAVASYVRDAEALASGPRDLEARLEEVALKLSSALVDVSSLRDRCASVDAWIGTVPRGVVQEAEVARFRQVRDAVDLEHRNISACLSSAMLGGALIAQVEEHRRAFEPVLQQAVSLVDRLERRHAEQEQAAQRDAEATVQASIAPAARPLATGDGGDAEHEDLIEARFNDMIVISAAVFGAVVVAFAALGPLGGLVAALVAGVGAWIALSFKDWQ